MKEDVAARYPYVVVQFLQLPHADIGDYSCVPHSWIRGRRATDRRSLVAYPDESPSITKLRIMNGDEPSEKWELYMAIIKLESQSYEHACEFIMEKNHNVSKNSNSDIMRIDSELLPDTTIKRDSPPLKKIKLPDPQSKKNRNKLKELVMKKPYEREHQDQASRDIRSSSDNLLLRYPYIQQIPETDNGTQGNILGAWSRSTGKTLSTFKDPLEFVNQICDYSQKPQENQLSIYQKHLHHLALTRGIQNKRIPNLRTFTLDIPEPLVLDPDIESNTSFVIQNPTNVANQVNQLEIAQPSPVIQEHPQVLHRSVKQKIPVLSSELECATSKPTTHSKMTGASHVSIAYTNLAEYQDSIVEDMVDDVLTETSCIEQNVFSGTTAEKEFSTNSKALEEANHSGQIGESSMEEKSPMVEVTSSGILLSQDVDYDEQGDFSDLSSDEIITTSPNSKEQANKLVISLLNQADVWADQLFDLFQKMKINFSETCQIAHDLYESLVQSQKVIECMANASENLRALKNGKVAVVTSKEVTMEVQKIAEDDQAERKEEENSDVSMEEDKEDNDADSKSSENDDDCDRGIRDVKGQDSHNEVPRKIRGHIRSFVLPPEYDPDDTRWTLKYRENDPKLNLVELVPRSNVFVNSLKLAHCKLTAKESKELARMLFVEVFSQSALSVCSLTGVKANAFDISGTHVRPGLDENARMTILTFVKDHSVKKHWATFDSQSIINSLRSKLQDIRAKHGKTA
ncbi:uncharacterized protein LOC111002644 isoform X3 [Pieris rapae]|uniref:uncharacterized protein LOC111002644 isoform X3 n=1 Tax=Pieris rapae TaxID=64459 RepID=UPI001E28062C|nr:uncharacterized protein LOC111002644 isoform X3 [Pieris rapae]XP_045490603.1 uncharacterized protein LOC111002644 isoform X3 [Pieris rapae]XP_045490604.1 uncharacterized protein LOC111002644 isoform X3 [Pieris rapae]XP_045490605.1 uncharacterized protein LOC111002644 isoform X3 [Pieris rapae]